MSATLDLRMPAREILAKLREAAADAETYRLKGADPAWNYAGMYGALRGHIQALMTLNGEERLAESGAERSLSEATP